MQGLLQMNLMKEFESILIAVRWQKIVKKKISKRNIFQTGEKNIEAIFFLMAFLMLRKKGQRVKGLK